MAKSVNPVTNASNTANAADSSTMRPLAIRSSSTMKLLLSIYALLMIWFARYAVITKAYSWLWDCSVTFLIVLIVYLLRNKLKLTSFTYAFFLFALGLHVSGVYGLYTHNYLGLDFDHYTHFFGSFAVAMILFNWLSSYSSVEPVAKGQVSARKILKKRLGTVCFIVILMTLGISAVHESIEFMGFHFLNADGGNFFFPGNAPVAVLTAADIGDSGTYYNTMIDILYNAIGAVAACVVMSIRTSFSIIS